MQHYYIIFALNRVATSWIFLLFRKILEFFLSPEKYLKGFPMAHRDLMDSNLFQCDTLTACSQ